MRQTLLFALLLLTAASGFAQRTKPTPPKGNIDPSQLSRRAQIPMVPAAENPFGVAAPNYNKQTTLNMSTPGAVAVKVTFDVDGLPVLFEGKAKATAAEAALPAGDRALAYVAALKPASIKNPAQEFTVQNVQTDEQGNLHVRLQQVYQNIPVYGSELIAHTQDGDFQRLNGRYFPTPKLASVTPVLDATAAIQKGMTDFGAEKVKTSWSAEELQLIGGTQHKTELVVYVGKGSSNGGQLAWRVESHPNMLRRVVYFIDAQSGTVINHYDYTCEIDGGRIGAAGHTHTALTEDAPEVPEAPAVFIGPVTATGLDLLDISRTFGAYQISGGQVLLEDASKAMFNQLESSMPNDPVGAIVTLDALNTSPENQTGFNYDFVSSSSTTFNNKTAVSGHWNSNKSYDYYKSTFNRNSIDGVGGNIVAFVNVADGDGSSMENAYWNGEAMFYGNGGSAFKKLARGLDVGGHEMTHGVVEKTANLEYQDESGALNESFADIFGAMIDRDDWKIGEDVMQTGVSPSGALRDLADPHNGASNISSPWWQPKHVNEKFIGSDDNGGVHINSGIPNYAFYLFANNAAVGKDKAEQVYYKALRDYLVKSSKFVDCRIAVLQAATDLYGASVANAAAAAFDAVGITGSTPGGNYLGQLSPNPGVELMLVCSDDGQFLNLAAANGQVLGTIYSDGVGSRPSITDNGKQIVFVNGAGDIITVDLQYSGMTIFPTVNPPFSGSPVWRNVAISKDGRFIAGITNTQDNRVYFWDLSDPFQFDPVTYFLYNPTYSQDPTTTGEVKYADVLEFDYSGTNLMYDAFNELTNSQGQDISYWDIGFLQFWENGTFAAGQTPFISKLFGGLPENTNVGDPVFAKNSPFIIAFDVFDVYANTYDIFGANTETGDNFPIVTESTGLGWPTFNKSDNKISFEAPGATGYTIYTQGLKPSKIEPQGGSTLFVDSHYWGVWFANGSRSLAVGTDEATSGFSTISASPNPTTDLTRISLHADTRAEALVQVTNLLGATVLSRTVQLEAGQNSFDLDLNQMPAGTYVVRVFAGKDGAAIKVVKN